MKNFDFLTKELVESLSYTTITKNRNAYTNVVIDGRTYTKYGTLQAVTIVGNLYKDAFDNKILMVGIAKQHPNDSKCNKQVAYEAAQAHALFNPDVIFNTVPDHLTLFNFSKMMEWYVDGMELEFIKTKQEIENTGQESKTFNR